MRLTPAMILNSSPATRQGGEAGYVPAWSRQIFHETTDKRISGTCHDDGNGRSHRPRGTVR
jgi:hypothetical protein